jgi:hypothetical protein
VFLRKSFGDIQDGLPVYRAGFIEKFRHLVFGGQQLGVWQQVTGDLVNDGLPQLGELVGELVAFVAELVAFGLRVVQALPQACCLTSGFTGRRITIAAGVVALVVVFASVIIISSVRAGVGGVAGLAGMLQFVFGTIFVVRHIRSPRRRRF